MAHNSRARVVTLKVVADNESNETCCLQWSVEVHMAAQPTYVADASRDIVVGSSYCRMTQQSEYTERW